MWKLKPLRRRFNAAGQLRRLEKIRRRQMSEHDRDTQKWAEERKIEARFKAARLVGKRKTSAQRSDAERFEAIGLIGG